MNICVVTQHIRGRNRMTTAIGKHLTTALERFSSKIRAVHLSVHDVNGPRGGIDKRCMIRISTVPRGIVIITAEANRVSTAVRQALRRAVIKLINKTRR